MRGRRYGKFGVGIMVVLVGVGAGCSGSGGQRKEGGVQALPDIVCKGKIVMNITGNADFSFVPGSGGSTSGTLQADCGDGFSLQHGGKK